MRAELLWFRKSWGGFCGLADAAVGSAVLLLSWIRRERWSHKAAMNCGLLFAVLLLPVMEAVLSGAVLCDCPFSCC